MEISKCKCCRSENLKFQANFEHEDTMTNEMVTHDVLMCLDCECIHWTEGDSFLYEFTPDIVRSRSFNSAENYVSDV